MVGFPYDDLDAWRAVYPPEVFIGQFEKVATGFEQAHANLAAAFQACRSQLTAEQRSAALQELSVGEAAAIHFRSTANQARFILARRRLKEAKSPDDAQSACAELERLLRAEMGLARRLHAHSNPRLAHRLRGVQPVLLRAGGPGGEGHQLPGPADALAPGRAEPLGFQRETESWQTESCREKDRGGSPR